MQRDVSVAPGKSEMFGAGVDDWPGISDMVGAMLDGRAMQKLSWPAGGRDGGGDNGRECRAV